MTKSGANPSKDDEIVINGKKYREVQSHRIYYSVSSHKSQKVGSLIDRGANGGIAGDDARIIEKSDRMVDVRGIDNHQITNIPIVTAGGSQNPKWPCNCYPPPVRLHWARKDY